MKPPLCFLVGPWDKVSQGVSIPSRMRELQHQRTHQKVSYKENSPELHISDKVAGCERHGSNSFSCGVILMITFQLAFPSSWELFQAPSSRLSLGHEVGSPILLLLGIQASTHQESFIRAGTQCWTEDKWGRQRGSTRGECACCWPPLSLVA